MREDNSGETRDLGFLPSGGLAAWNLDGQSLGGWDGYGNSSYRKAVPESLNLDTLLGMPDAARRIEDKQDERS